MMPPVSRSTLVGFLDRTLQTAKYEDQSLNGLQVEGAGIVRKAAFAVDASLETFEAAADSGADFLMVHHGLFWGLPYPITSHRYRAIRTLIESGISLYASHLPLDVHKRYGNNAGLAKIVGATNLRLFGAYHNASWGYAGTVKPTPLARIVSRFEKTLGCKAVLHAFGKKTIQRIGFVSGGGSFAVEEAAERELDLLVSGEPSHSRFHLAQELGINALFLGHYATETLGVKAMREVIKRRFGIKTVFLDIPTGL
ncbi:MAG: Nif3-like dinuclear metal center hexameric protein [archaeon]